MPPKRGIRPFKPMQRVSAKMPGYAPWPAFVVPQEDIPEDVSRVKPKKGTPYCVIFIPDGDYYWISENGISDLSEEKLKASLRDISPEIKRKMKNLKGVVRGKQTPIKNATAAADGLTYDDFIDHLAKFNGEVEEEEEEEDEEVQEEEVEEQEEDPEQPEEEVEEQDDDDEEEEKQQQKQKQKQEEEEEERSEHIAKSRSKKIKVKSRNGKSDDDEADYGDNEEDEESGESSVQPRKSSTNGKNLTKQSKASIGNGRKRRLIEAEEKPRDIKRKTPAERRPGNGGLNLKNETSDEDFPVNKRSSLITPASGLDKPVLSEKEKQHQLWLCRVKLQKSLIQRNQPNTPKDTIGLKPPTADELLTARLILYRLLEFPIDKELLRKTKMHKVLKTIMKDKSLQYSDSFKLHDRCEEVLNKWHEPIEELRNEKVYEHKRNHSKEEITGVEGGIDTEGDLDNGNSTISTNTINDNGIKSLISSSAASSSEINKKMIVHPQDDSEVSGLEQSISELDQPKKSELLANDI